MDKKLIIGINCEICSYYTKRQHNGSIGIYVNVIDDENTIHQDLYAGEVKPNLLEYMSLHDAGIINITDDAKRVYNTVEQMLNTEWKGIELVKSK